ELSEIVLQQPDIFKGMQAFRGLGKPPLAVPERYNPFGTFCKVEPGYWGEHDELGEEVMTKWAQPGAQCTNVALDVTSYVTMLQQRLMERPANILAYNIWQVLVYGRYTALNTSGQIIHEAQFNNQSISAAR